MVIFEPRMRFRSAGAVQVGRPQAEQLLSLETGRAGRPSVAGEQAHHGHEGLALARTALADHAQAFAGGDRQGHAADGLDEAVMGLETDPQVVDRQYGSGHGTTHSGGQAGRP